ncbi:MAG: hypothetical protein CVU13_01385 [Bacteroidetes bacterium HGW-Bacteroidetes-8]|jgi:uncharacterized membrane protein (DUF485 family)|nr:MAG: hypothetical protein CVU13_01385 [Bacteroidetes bacterium HGW-Bacteroidetes-8]
MHGPAAKLGKDNATSKKTRLGVILFLFYTLVYGGFVLIGLVNPELMGLHVIGAQNLAIVYGFGLILLAIIMGFIYNAVCTRMENRLNK